jgi:hypothetical protein
LYSSPNIARVIKSRGQGRARQGKTKGKGKRQKAKAKAKGKARHGRGVKYKQTFHLEGLKEKNHFDNLSVRWSTILNFISKQFGVRMFRECIWLRTGYNGRMCEHANKPSRGGEFLDQQNNNLLLSKASA